MPKPTHPFPSRKRAAPSPGSQQTISVTLKPIKASAETTSLPSQSPDTTILDLKTEYAQKANHDVSKIKLLYNKRPASDLKTLKELLPEPTPKEVEFSVMIMGGAGVASPAAPSTPALEIPDPTKLPAKTQVSDPAPLSEKAESLAQTTSSSGNNAADVLKSDDFWADLKGFLVQRLKDEAEGERLLGLFKKASSV